MADVSLRGLHTKRLGRFVLRMLSARDPVLDDGSCRWCYLLLRIQIA